MIFEINVSKVKSNYLMLKNDLPEAVIAYAIKANYDDRILRALASIGCVAEVCSDYEHRVALKAGFKRVIRNGFGKHRLAWLTNVETVNDVAGINGLVGARLQLSVKSKLGISEDEIIKHEWDCISFHTRDGFNEALNKAVSIADSVGAKYVDVGGGVSIDRVKLLKKLGDRVIIEPGRYLVENACQVRSKVLAVKGDKLIIDVGMNFLNKFSNSRFTVKAVKSGVRNHSYRVFGPVPTDVDNIGFHNLPELSVGDEVIIGNAGAYTLSMASNWTHKIPKIKYIE